MKYHIIHSENLFHIVETVEYRENVYSRKVGTFYTLDSAQEYVNMLCPVSEDSVPVNAMSGGHVATFDPLLTRIKRILRRKKPNA